MIRVILGPQRRATRAITVTSDSEAAMNRLITATTALALTMLAPIAASTDKDGEVGRYQGVEASESAVWVIDTKTGRVRKCTQEFADTAPVCSAFSK
jgi:hypothetical protein